MTRRPAPPLALATLALALAAPSAPDRDPTARIQALLDAGGAVRLGPGVHRLGTLRLPEWPITAELVGEGPGVTILEPLRAGEPILGRARSRVVGCRVANLTLRAHPEGGGAAVELAGHSACDLERIQISGRWDAGILLDASGRGCYGNAIRRLACEGTPSPKVLVGSTNSGRGVASNANNVRIADLWCYSTRGMEAVLDLGDTTQAIVSGGLIESAHGAVAVVPGNATVLEGLWIESVGDVVRCRAPGSSVTPNWLTIRDCYVSPKRPIPIPSHARGWKVEGSPATAEITTSPASAPKPAPSTPEARP